VYPCKGELRVIYQRAWGREEGRSIGPLSINKLHELEAIGFVIVVPARRARDRKPHVLTIVGAETGRILNDVRNAQWVSRTELELGTGGWLARRIKALLETGRLATIPLDPAIPERRPLSAIGVEIEMLAATTFVRDIAM